MISILDLFNLQDIQLFNNHLIQLLPSSSEVDILFINNEINLIERDMLIIIFIY